eukprot:TRINITY_DN8459_c0_g1_i1.p1 TRINITY_DN8459_c0_g1~~TRINITY_DN8459_c0_g1_i1.p1  ORF type:complete len:765 (+),score=207.80 TRINITY_DN8459_c0_g1_i1:72-2297(+)
MPAKIPYAEVAKHCTPSDCWVIIGDGVYDLTDFAPSHPGGAAIVTDEAARDCTKPFLQAHPESIMELTMGRAGLAAAYKGDIDRSTVPETVVSGEAAHAAAEEAEDSAEIPPVKAMLNLHDFEAVAEWRLVTSGKKQAWDYYSSGADDEYTYRNNVAAFQRLWLKPRVLVNVAKVDTTATILGTKCPMPVFYSAVAMCGMGHSDGEVAWMRSAGEAGIIFMFPNLSSRSYDDIVGARRPGQTSWFQMYVNPDREIARTVIKKLEKSGVQALAITVDSAVAGKRERDLRNKIKKELGQAKQQQAAAGKARAPGNYANRDPALCWDDVRWFQRETRLPLIIKGVQCGVDAVRAAEMGCQAILLSNHGGRNLDTARSGIEVLPEVMDALRQKGLEGKIEVYVDGGVRRGTDIIKALALGATAVGLGKPAVFAMSAYGEEGMVAMLDVLKKELVQSMQLCGAASLRDITPGMVDATHLGNHAVPVIKPVSPYQYTPTVRHPPAPPVPVPPTPPVAAPSGGHFWRYLLRTSGGGVLASSGSARLHRSAVLLVLYSVLHGLRNVLSLAGKGPFNAYCHALRSSPLFRLLEYYLLLGAGVHAAAAATNVWRKRRMLTKGDTWTLSWTGACISAFLVMHVRLLRFGRAPMVKAADGGLIRDVHALQMQVFNDTPTVAYHLVAVWALCRHFQVGWPKTLFKIPADDPAAQDKDAMKRAGRDLAGPLAASFAIAPLYMWLSQRPQVARFLR